MWTAKEAEDFWKSIVRERDVGMTKLLADVERLESQLDDLIGSVYENCNPTDAPYVLADSIEEANAD